jgi:wyosine [tRNA(Phe)-imidazoG37] synthetase (radical SAM superfamily)
MTADKEKTANRGAIESLIKAKVLLQQSLPEIAKLIKTFDVVERARKLSDPKNIETISEGVKKLADATLVPREIIKHAASDFQLKDLFSTIERFIAKANPAFVDMLSKEVVPKEAPTKEPSKTPRVKKLRSKRKSLKKAASKKARPQKKTVV